MSMIGSLLAFVIIPLKARPRKENSVTAFALDFWRNAGARLLDENERLLQENRQLREERYRLERQIELIRLERIPSRFSQAQQNNILQQTAQQQLALYQQLQNQKAAQNPSYQQGLNELQHWDDLCNCVPARGDLFLGSPSLLG